MIVQSLSEISLHTGNVQHNRLSICKCSAWYSLPTRGAPRKNAKNDNDLKTSPRQAAWKNSPEKGSKQKRGNISAELTFFFFLFLQSFFSMSAAGQFSKFVVIWRLVVFRNISQRFDSISGMLSMTLVWNQRTTLENEGGGGKRTFKEEPLVRVNQQARGAVTSLQAPPTPQKPWTLSCSFLP